MITGHTKFAPDRYFGLFKKNYRDYVVDTLDDMTALTYNISKGKHITAIDLRRGNFQAYDFKERFSQMYKPVHGIQKMHHIRFEKSKPGIALCQEYVDSSVKEVKILKDPKILYKTLQEKYPLVVKSPKGLTPERKLYLYEQIREHCEREESKEIVAPISFLNS